MSTGKPKEPGPIRRALFQDVPYILDSLWRIREFQWNRLGHVDFEKTYDFAVRPAWMSGAFALYVIVCIFTVFGPTLDAMCSVDSTGFVAVARVVLSVLFAAAAVALLVVTVNSAAFHLARKGQILTDEACKNDAALQAKRGPAAGGTWARLWATFPFLSAPQRCELRIALLMCCLGAIILALPLAGAAVTLYTVEVEALSCVQSVNAPLVWAQIGGLVILLGGGMVVWVKWGKEHALAVFGASCVMLALVIGILWWRFASPDGSEAAGGFYPHVYVYLVGTLLVVAAAAYFFARKLFGSLVTETSDKFTAALASVDMLGNERDPPDVSSLRLWSALINGIAGHLLHFLLLPAFVAFAAPTQWLYWYTLFFVVVSLCMLVYGSLSSRWAQMVIYVDRWFLVGTPLVISILVIVIAVLRLAGVQYVATVIDATPFGVLFLIVVMLYAAVWYFEYWINRWIGEELLAVVNGRNKPAPGYVPWAFAYSGDHPPWANVKNRYVALHGTGRLCAHGWYERTRPQPGDEPRGAAFTTYGFSEFFSKLGVTSDKGDDLGHEIGRRVGLYFNVINLVLIGAMGGLIALHFYASRPLDIVPMVDVKAVQPVLLSEVTRHASTEQTLDPFAERLIAQAAASRPSLVVAASGGGTRAAVYTAVALEGIARIDRARDVVLLSGVSGGGVSAAVFASRYDDLTISKPGVPDPGKTDPWADYVEATAQPFIQDVLEGIGEQRIAGVTSLGALLQESLQRRVFSAGKQRMADIKTPALILNTAISGHPYDDSELLKGRVASPLTTAPCVQKSRPFANLAGGRLIFTNLTNTNGFPRRSPDAPDLWLPYQIINFGDVKLSSAAALTANFPPVFSNARVSIEPDDEEQKKGACPQSYFVTDGGATENLGLVSALYALRGTLTGIPSGTKISNIHILALEASAVDYDYSDDRGVGAATGGSKERINAGLTQRLIEDVRAQATRLGVDLAVHYLPLPVAFRSRGGFGTHWMFAPSVRVSNPHLPQKPDNSILPWVTPRDQEDLDRKQVMLLLRSLFDPDDPICKRSDRLESDPANPANVKYYTAGWKPRQVQRVARWICGHDDKGRPDAKPDFQVEAWQGVVDALRPPMTAAN